MTVLVGYASVRSSTKEFAEEIADRLMKSGVKACVRGMAEVESLACYDAIVLGSAVRNGAWLPNGRKFLTQHEAELVSVPVWLFSVSAVGTTSNFLLPRITRLIRRTSRETQAVAAPRELPRFYGHRGFAGRIERGQWARAGDLLLQVCGGCPKDHGGWRDVDEWATGIAGQLLAAEWAKERTRLRLVPPPPSTSGRAR
jgi:menaquinone-dependent protoporphyrinogen oxidase